MKQETLKLLFRAIDGQPNDDIVKVAHRIIEEEEGKGHHNLANSLKEILKNNVETNEFLHKELKDIFGSIPKSTRDNIPLAKSIERRALRHYMVLSKEVEARFKRIEQEYTAKERLALKGLVPKKKILFYGPPGCGKSMGAERIAWNLGLPFLKVQFEAIISSYLGESATNLKKLFEAIHEFPCVLLLDECDFIARSRNYKSEVGEMVRIVNILLNLLEDYNAPGLVIATTNLDTSLDKAIFRRFDEVLEIPKPGEQEIVELLKLTLSAIETKKRINWRNFAKKMDGFSAAAVVKVAKDAAKSTVLLEEDLVTENHLETSLREAISSNRD